METLGEVLEEFIGSSLGANLDPSALHEWKVKGETSRTYLVWNHEEYRVKKEQTRRYIEFIRDPIEIVDSWAQLKMTKNHTEKLQNEERDCEDPMFQDLKIFSMRKCFNSIQFTLLSENIVKYVVRYQDILKGPAETFKNALTFILRAPIERTTFKKKVEEKFQKNSLTSHDRTTNTSEIRGNEKWRE